MSRNQLAAAEERFAAAIKQCPADERAHWGVAQTLWKGGSHEAAIEHMAEAVRLSGGNPDYLAKLGEMYLKTGRGDEAAATARQILARHRDHADGWALLGDAHRSQRAWDEALQAYGRSLLLRPDNPPVQLSAAEIYRQMDRPDRALATLDRVLDHRPAMALDGELQLTKGLALVDLGRPDEASEALAVAATHLPPAEVGLRLQLAAAQHQVGAVTQARATLDAVRAEYPQDAEAARLQTMFGFSFDHLATGPLGEGMVR